MNRFGLAWQLLQCMGPRWVLFHGAYAVRQVTASYEDWRGCRHQREVTLGSGRCLVSDRLSGVRREAVLRWLLSPDTDWELAGSTCSSPLAVIRVTGAGITGSRLAEGWESLFYNAKRPLKVFEISVAANVADIETEITFA